jgi:hypothetical protein
MTSPPQHVTWNAEVDKLKNRLSVLSQSSMDGEDQKRLREIGMAQDREQDSDGGETVGRREEAGQSDFVKARRQADHADEMRYDCESSSPVLRHFCAFLSFDLPSLLQFLSPPR